MRLLAIDGNSILNRAFYGVRLLSNKKGMYTNAIFGFLNILLKLRKDYPTDCVAVTFDMRAPTFRHQQYDGYKANRKGMPEELAMQLAPLKEILTALGYRILEKEGYEADDILGTLAKECSESGNDCVIATGDRDSLQLVDAHVAVCLVKTKENVYCDVERIQQDYGMAPPQIVDLKALMGDASDNIPGVKGIGEKTALSLIQNYHTIEEIYRDVEALSVTPRIKKLLNEGKDSAFMSKELATIVTDVPLDCKASDCTVGEQQSQKLSLLLTELEMFSFLKKFELQASIEQEKPLEESLTAMGGKQKVELRTDYSLDKLRKKTEELGRIDFLKTDRIYLIFPGEIVPLPEEWLKEIIFQSDCPKRTFEAKQFYKLGWEMGCEFKNLTFDVELAAYLLNVSSKGYALSDLIGRYLIGREYAIEEPYQTAAAFSDLCDALEQEVREQNMENLLREIELPLCEVLSSMEYEGFAVNRNEVTGYGKELSDQIEFLKEELFRYAGKEFNPNSTKELGVILFDELGLPAKKKTKTGYSTNAEVLQSLLGQHPIIECLLEYRKLTKLHSTYITGLLKVIAPDGRVHSTFNQTETRTGRISSTEPNVQNIPVRTKEGSKIREFFVPREGYVLVDADYSQIELRILAHIADDKDMQKAFQDGVDIHQMTASQVFKIPLELVTPQMRSRAKAINFGIVYGIGAYSLSQDIHVPVYEAKEYIEEYLKTYHGVRTYMDEIVKFAEENGYVETLYHRRRDLADIRSTNKVVKALAKRIALNTPIQGTAADIIKIAMIRVYRRLKAEGVEARLILQVHDELIIEAPVLQAQMVAELLKEEMQSAAKLSVQLLVDVHTGNNWLEAKG